MNLVGPHSWKSLIITSRLGSVRLIVGSNLPAALSEGMKVGLMTILVAEIDRWDAAKSA